LGGDLALIAWILLALSLAVVLGTLVLAARRMAIRRPGGAVECALRLGDDARWQRGVMAYRTGRLLWFRSMRAGLRPDAVFDRQALRVVERCAVDRGVTVIRFETGTPGETVRLQLTPDAATGLLAWLEAGPRRWLGEGALDRP